MSIFQNALPALKLSRPKMPGLHFIEEQKQITLVAKFAESEQIFRRRNCDSAFALDRFDQNRNCRSCNRRAHSREIVEPHMLESRDPLLETLLPFFLTCRRALRQRSTAQCD